MLLLLVKFNSSSLQT